VKSIWDSWRRTLSGEQPHRCHACGWRGWGADTGPKFNVERRQISERAVASEPEHRLDLRALDLPVEADTDDSVEAEAT
jgi:hypothetical protein